METDRFLESLDQNNNISLPPQDRSWDLYSSVAPLVKDLLQESCAFPADLRIADLRHAVVRSLIEVPPSLRGLLPTPPSDTPPFRIALGALLDPFGSADSVLLLEDLVGQAQVFDGGMAWAEAWAEFGAGLVPRAECPDIYLDSLRRVLVASLALHRVPVHVLRAPPL